MAAPILDSITPASVTLAPGQFADVTISAHDPDSGTGTADIPITDSAGTAVVAHVDIRIADPITFGTAVVNGVAVTVQRITPANVSPATYRITAA